MVASRPPQIVLALAIGGSTLGACSLFVDAAALSEGESDAAAVTDDAGVDVRGALDGDDDGAGSDGRADDVVVAFDTAPGPCGDGVVNPGEQCDLGAVNGTADACCSGACTFVGSASVCRVAAGPCDVPETCTGSSPTCPANALASDGTSCTPPVAGACNAGTCEAIGGNVAYWAFDETTGTSAADAVGGNTGTLTSGATWTSAGKVKGAVLLDGVDDYVAIADSASLQQAGDLTIAVWIRPTNLAKGRQSIVNKSVDNEYELILEPGGGLSFYQGGGAWEEIDEPAGWFVPQDAWSHVAVTRVVATKTLSFWLNGTMIGTDTFVATPTTSTLPVQIGVRVSSFWFEGAIDEARIYSRALSGAEIARLASAR